VSIPDKHVRFWRYWTLVACLCALSAHSKASAQALERANELSAHSLYYLMSMARSGDVDAQEAIGLKYAYAEGVEWNLPKGIKWLQKAAQDGNADAECALGQIYDNGLIFAGALHRVAPDYAKSVQWYRRAAARGWCWIQLAEAYQDKAGSDAKNHVAYERDLRAAAHWWRKDAEPRKSYPAVYPYAKFSNGNPIAQERMGYSYRFGLGVPRSYEHALAWYRKAARQGNGSAMMSLGYMYEQGLGTPVNDELAYVFFGLAPANLDARCHQCTDGMLSKLAKRLTVRQVTQAQAVIGRWQPGMTLPTAGKVRTIRGH
jgi:uncharacterized protein